MAAGVETVARRFNGRTASLVGTYAAILKAARALGTVREEPKKTSIHLVRSSAFAGVAAQKAALVLTLKSDRDVPSKRIRRREQVSANRWHLEVRLEAPGDVDREVRGWLERAYSLAGPTVALEGTVLPHDRKGPTKRTPAKKRGLREKNDSENGLGLPSLPQAMEPRGSGHGWEP